MEANFTSSNSGQISNVVDSTTDENHVKKPQYTYITPADSTTGCETSTEDFTDSESNTEDKRSASVNKRTYKRRSAVERQLETSLNPNFVGVDTTASPLRSRYGRLQKTNFPTDCLPLDIVLNTKSADRLSPLKSIKTEMDTSIKSSPAVAAIDKLVEQNRNPLNITSEQDYNISLKTTNSFTMSPIKIITPNETVRLNINAEQEVTNNDIIDYNNKNSLSLKLSFSIQSNANNLFSNDMDLSSDNSPRTKDNVLKTYSRATSTNNSMYDPENDLCLDIVEHLNSNTVNIIENPLKSFSKFNSYNSHADSDDDASNDNSSIYNFNIGSSTTLRTYSKKLNTSNEQNIKPVFTNNFFVSKLKTKHANYKEQDTQELQLPAVEIPAISSLEINTQQLDVKEVPKSKKTKLKKTKSPRVTKSERVKLNSLKKGLDSKKGINKSMQKNNPVQKYKDATDKNNVTEELSLLHPFVSEDQWYSGELAWARIGSYPFWPCLVCPDPRTGKCIRRLVQKQRDKDPIQIVHVRFYADNGRRSELRSSLLIPFKGVKEFNERAESLTAEEKRLNRRYAAAFLIPPKQKQHWQQAVDEAALMVTKSIKERLDYFTILLTNIKNMKKGKAETQLSLKINMKNESDTVIAASKSTTEVKKSATETEKIVAGVKRAAEDNPKSVPLKKRKIIFEEANFVAPVEEKKVAVDKKRLSLKKKSQRSVSDPKKASAKELVKTEAPEIPKHVVPSPKMNIEKPKRSLTKRLTITNEEKSAKKNIKAEKKQKTDLPKKEIRDENSNTKRKRKISENIEEIEIKKEIVSDTDSPKAKRARVASKSTETVKQKVFEDVKIKCETSDISDSVSELDNKKDRLEPTTKISLFKGLTKEKACLLCETTGNVLKCRGVCCGYFHYDCVLASRPPAPAEVQEQIEAAGNVISEVTVFEEAANARMQEILSNAEDQDADANLSSTTDEEDRQTIVSATNSNCIIVEIKPKHQRKLDKINNLQENGNKVIKHVTGDCISAESPPPEPVNDIYSDFKCNECLADQKPPCFVCQSNTSPNSLTTDRQKCSFMCCAKFFHIECLKLWPQTKYGSGPVLRTKIQRKLDGVQETLTCPYHLCHTCVSDDPRGVKNRLGRDRLTKCIKCPTAYHTDIYCIPAGAKLLTKTQLICPKHYQTVKLSKAGLPQHVNASWCFLCAEGGSLICCETCPTSFHAECLKISPPEGHFICEDCENGRFPLYEEIVWCKLGQYRWWPARILPPAEVPHNVQIIKHFPGEFCVRFFGTLDHYWVTRGRVFLYQEGDTGNVATKKKMDDMFIKAVREATDAFAALKKQNETRAAENAIKARPPPYIKIKTNKPVGNVRVMECDVSSMTPCDCDPGELQPCAQDSDCLNRILLTECNPSVCRAGIRCLNQCFEKREYPPLEPCRTTGRGWGLKTLADIKKGNFVIEYVGEMIDDEEFKRRIQRKHEMKDENFYFLTIDNNRLLDAGPKGNVARFMNHSCEPNCETQKWTVNGDTRVGLFALMDITAGTELTFNYNLECASADKKKCMCGAGKCAGFIGAKTKSEEQAKKTTYFIKPTLKIKLKKKTSSKKIVNKSLKLAKKTIKITKKNVKITKKNVKITKKTTKVAMKALKLKHKPLKLGKESKNHAITSTPIDTGKIRKHPVCIVPFNLDSGEININPLVKRKRGRPKKIVTHKFNNLSNGISDISIISNHLKDLTDFSNDNAKQNHSDQPVVDDQIESTTKIIEDRKHLVLKRKRGRPRKSLNMSIEVGDPEDVETTSKESDDISLPEVLKNKIKIEKSVDNERIVNEEFIEIEKPMKLTPKVDNTENRKNKSRKGLVDKSSEDNSLPSTLPLVVHRKFNNKKKKSSLDKVMDNSLPSTSTDANLPLVNHKKFNISKNKSVRKLHKKDLSLKSKSLGSPIGKLIGKKLKTKINGSFSPKIKNKSLHFEPSTSLKLKKPKNNFKINTSPKKKTYLLSKKSLETSEVKILENSKNKTKEVEIETPIKEMKVLDKVIVQKRGRGRPKKNEEDNLKKRNVKGLKLSKSLPAKIISTSNDLINQSNDLATLPVLSNSLQVKLPVLEENVLNMKISKENHCENILKLQIIPLEKNLRRILSSNENISLNIPEENSILLNSYKAELMNSQNHDETVEDNLLTALQLRKKPVAVNDGQIDNKALTRTQQLHDKHNSIMHAESSVKNLEKNEIIVQITEKDMEIVKNAEFLDKEYNHLLKVNNKSINSSFKGSVIQKKDKKCKDSSKAVEKES